VAFDSEVASPDQDDAPAGQRPAKAEISEVLVRRDQDASLGGRTRQLERFTDGGQTAAPTRVVGDDQRAVGRGPHVALEAVGAEIGRLTDGNKRIGAFLFIWFLQRNRHHLKPSGAVKINDNALTAIALLVAQSDPAQKEVMVRLIMNLIRD
jgi:hypothetical protein